MRKGLATLIALAFFTSSLTSTANAAIRVGGKCSTKGQIKSAQGKQFVCLKSGKKLTWRQLTTDSKKSAVTETEFIPWSIPTSLNQELIAFHKNIDLWFKDKPLNKVSLNIYFDPQSFPSEIPWINDALTFQAQLMGQSDPATYKIYFSKKDEWIISKRKEVMPGLDNWNPKYVCYEGINQGCASSTSREAFFVWNATSLTSPAEDWQLTRSLSHEFFHITQCDLVGDASKCGANFNNIPAWFAEGGPNVIGAIFMNRLGNLDYLKQRNLALNIYANGLNGAYSPLSDFSKNIRYGNLYPYEIGMIACEYLIASAGLQAFFDLYVNLPKTGSFEEAFQKSFGIKLEDFYTAFDKSRENLAFYPVKV